MKTRTIILLLFCSIHGLGSDSIYVRQIADSLASKHFWGRGYTKDGMARAATYIAAEMKLLGMEVKTQDFFMPVNIFDGDMDLTLDGRKLRPGIDFLVDAASRPSRSRGALQQVDSVNWVQPQSKIQISLVDKLTWRVSREQEDFTRFWVKKGNITNPKKFKAKVGAGLNPNFKATNVMGIIKGTKQPDSMVVFTAHYDHLGGMGKEAFFAGANDNASGVGFMLGLARYYAAHPPPYTLVFIAFGAEEAGLVGSKYFVENPLIELNKIRFLLNFDLMGNGEEGITIVNATGHLPEYELLKKLNEHKGLLQTVNARDNAPNSDHYWFAQKGVPAFFIYTLGARKAYHDLDDVRETLPWPALNNLMELMKDFVGSILNYEL